MISHQQPLKKRKERHLKLEFLKYLVLLFCSCIDLISFVFLEQVLKEGTVYTRIKPKLIYLSERN